MRDVALPYHGASVLRKPQELEQQGLLFWGVQVWGGRKKLEMKKSSKNISLPAKGASVVVGS